MRWLLVTLLLGSCSVSIDFEGIPCPCADGWSCDESRQVCVSGQGSVCGRLGAQPGEVVIDDFSFMYATGESIRWQWEIADDSELSHFEIDWADTQEDLDSASSFNTADGAINPELGRTTLPRSGRNDPVRATTIRGLNNREAPYFFRLVTVGRSGGLSCSPILSARTTLLDGQSISLYDDDALPGLQLPGCIQRTADPATSHAGSAAHYEYTVACSMDGCTSMPGETCFENVRFQNLNIPPSGLTSERFSRAFVEMAVAVTGTEAFWSELGLHVDTGAQNNSYVAGAITLLNDGTYHIYQIPLSRLRCIGCALSPLLEFGDIVSIDGFRVGSTFRDGGIIRVDSARIRW